LILFKFLDFEDTKKVLMKESVDNASF